MSLISGKGYENAGVKVLKIKKNWWTLGKYETCWKWFRCYKYISDLVSKEIKGIYEKKKQQLTK